MRCSIHLSTASRTFAYLIAAVLALAVSAGAAKTCLDCHKDFKATYGAFKFQHQPSQQGDCESCHKRHGFAQTLILKDNTSELCYQCHSDLKEQYSGPHAHFPVSDGVCWDCHNPHASNTENVVRDLPPETGYTSICQVCHNEEMTQAGSKAVVHQPYASGDCGTCHGAHATTEPSLLLQPPDSLCGTCHSPSDKKLRKAHEKRYADGLPCTSCHGAHSSDQPGLISEKAHAPFSAGECETCHSLPDTEGKVQMETGVAVADLCAACHDDITSRTTKAHPHAAVESSNCAVCHHPHSSRHASLLLLPEKELCDQCHDGIMIGGDTLAPHAPALLGQCTECHEVHGSDRPSLVEKSGADLCLGCHGEIQQGRDSLAHVHAAVDECASCHAPHEGLTQHLLVKQPEKLCLDCHEIDKSILDAASSHQPYSGGECLKCHQPHFSDKAGLVRADDNQVCLGCHGPIAMRLEMEFPHPPAQEECRSCHKAHFSEHEESLLTGSELEMCTACHDGADLDLNKKFVHSAAAAGDCAACHNPHGAPRKDLLTGRIVRMTAEGRTIQRVPRLTDNLAELCYQCHGDLQKDFTSSNAHQPVRDGRCEVCHTAHGSDHEGFVAASASELCGTCHAPDSLATQHHGYAIGATDCLDCHNPHFSPREKLVRAQAHEPFAGDDCSSCHEVKPDGSAGLAVAQNELCSACHESVANDAARRHMHGPFAAGECDQCHRVHAADQPSLLRSSPDRLCGECHDDVMAQDTLPVAHRPFGEGSCIACHKPHSSDYPNLATLPAESFCLSCHEELGKELESGVVHAPVVAGECGSCHEPHASQNEALLLSQKQDLCASCHDPKDATLLAAHSGFDIATSNCQNCHAAHAARKGVAGLLLPDKHAPFADGDCSVCHAGNSTSSLVAETSDLCYSCHENVVDKPHIRFVHQPVAEPGGCTECHGAHVGYGKALTLREGVDVCLSCHNDREFTGKNKHQAAFEDCGTCHSAHGSQYSGLLETADIIGLCMTCHDKALETHFHPMGDKALDQRTGQPLNCVGCHSAHSSDHNSLLVADQERRLCIVCHAVSQ